MATIQKIIWANEAIRKIGLMQNGALSAISMEFFGIKTLIDERELVKLSEAEKRTHELEDKMISDLYAHTETKEGILFDGRLIKRNGTAVEGMPETDAVVFDNL